MKKVIFTVVIAFFAFTTQAQTKEVKQDSVKLFYGMTAEKFLKLSVPEAKSLIKEKRLTVSEYLGMELRAKNHLLRLKIKKDSIETMRIYDRIGKKLGMKKDDGKN